MYPRGTFFSALWGVSVQLLQGKPLIAEILDDSYLFFFFVAVPLIE